MFRERGGNKELASDALPFWRTASWLFYCLFWLDSKFQLELSAKKKRGEMLGPLRIPKKMKPVFKSATSCTQIKNESLWSSEFFPVRLLKFQVGMEVLFFFSANKKGLSISQLSVISSVSFCLLNFQWAFFFCLLVFAYLVRWRPRFTAPSEEKYWLFRVFLHIWNTRRILSFLHW